MITISPEAQRRLETVLQPGELFRIEVQAGGCNGFSHSFSTTREVGEDDSIINNLVVMDTVSQSLIGDAELGFHKTIAESRFVLTIPGATSFCGCGKSFNI